MRAGQCMLSIWTLHCFSHDRLFWNVRSHGIKGEVANWMKNLFDETNCGSGGLFFRLETCNQKCCTRYGPESLLIATYIHEWKRV